MKKKRALCIASILPFMATVSIAQSTVSEDNMPVSEAITEKDNSQTALAATAIQQYWTADRMAKAKPRTSTIIVDEQSLLETAPVNEAGAELVPGYVPGCPPNSGGCNPVPRTFSSKNTSVSDDESAAYGNMLLTPMHGDKPVNPKNGPYGPFQRWREATPITTYPKAAIGKLFFTLNGGNYVCSASVIGRSTLITAGHCNSDGAGHWATNRLFCPNYDNGQNATRGCWTIVTSAISTRWLNSKDPDYDYSCLVTATTGTKQANKIGNVTGWLGRAWNFSSNQAERTFGYPAGAPFNGVWLQTTASTDWYTHDFQTGGQVSKIIGSDLTGGSSGGPWILGWTGGLAETADTDSSSITDPGNNWVNGVNSHKRCLVNCNTPPTTTNGVFWQEMTSPPFRNTTADNGESEDVIALCLAHANNNP